MDKTISISLGGFSFIVDDRAFFKLKNYLDEIRHSLHGMEGTEDIIADVEVRIAELFKERLGVREVVNESDVDYVVGIMGRPEQFVDEDSEEKANSYSSQSSSSRTYSGERVKKKLYRDPDDKIIAGVLSGLAHYLGVDTWITRVVFIILMFSDMFISLTSISVISYIVLWIILPKADTASQKYEMFGQAGDFETIKKNANQAAAEMKGVAKNASNSLGDIFRVVFKMILFFIGFSLILTGIGLIIGSIALFFTATSNIPVEFFGYFVDHPWQEWVVKGLLFLLIVIPGVLLILFGVRLISDRIKINKTFVIGSIALWIMAIFGSALMAGSLFNNYSREIEFADKKGFTVNSDTIKISFDQYKDFNQRQLKWRISDEMGGLVEFDNKLHRRIQEDLNIKVSPNNQVFIEVLYHSKGSSMDNARTNAEKIQYNYQMNANGELKLDNYFSLPKGSKFRDQDVEITIYVPKGKVVNTQNVDEVELYNMMDEDVEYYDAENKYFRFENNSFLCLNCMGNYQYGYDGSDLVEIGHEDSARVQINSEGINVQDGNDKVIINKDKIQITDGTDSINLNISGN